MKKNTRHAIIKDIIENYEVATQEELADYLYKRGYETTQATVSRDIKQMGLIKVKGVEKKFKYAIPDDADVSEAKSTANIFKAVVLSIDSSLNIIVIKTNVGSASVAASFIDNLKINKILGTISGDDTILLVSRSIEDVPFIMEELNRYL